jgi:DNA-binding NtrC family response regulator
MEAQRKRVSIAVVDDYRPTVEAIIGLLQRLDCQTAAFTDPNVCLATLSGSPVDILITDIDMPQMDGISLMERVKASSPSTEVIVVTGNADKQNAIKALKKGAYDFFEKPVGAEELIATVSRTIQYRAVVLERDRYADKVLLLSSKEAKQWGINAFVGKSQCMREIIKQIMKLHRATIVNVLIRGESGTGKELVARAIHYGGPRSDKPFVPINCAAVPAELVESTLFGHVRGAFTGAVSDRPGAFVQANGGTLFLDEIGDMPAMMQAKLLRVIEDGLVVPVGGSKEVRVDVHVVAATNADLAQRVADGDFRQDLFFRIAGYTLSLPPLRERRADIPLLANHFVETLASEAGIPRPEIGVETMAALSQHDFPGNVRELRNLIGHALVECEGLEIGPDHLQFSPLYDSLAGDDGTAHHASAASGLLTEELPLNLAEVEAIIIRKALALADGNMSKAARKLGIGRSRLYRKLSVGDIEA